MISIISKNFENKYVKIINKFNKNVIVAGKVINVKQVPVSCITFDNRYFFSVRKNFLYNIIVEDKPIIEKKFDFQKYKFFIKLWRKAINHPKWLIFREFDFSEIDKEILPLVNSLNKLTNIQTVSSCCGHGKSVAWVDIKFYDFLSVQMILNIIDKQEFKNKFILTSLPRIFNNSNNSIILSLQTSSIGKDAYNDVLQLSKYIDNLNNIY